MKKLILVSVSMFFLAGCATIFSNSSDPIAFNSVPEGAKVQINGMNIGKTPVTVPVKRSISPPQVLLKLDGYESQYIMLQNSFAGVGLLNILFWPGFIVDAATGAMMKYEPLSYEIELDKNKEVKQ